MARRFSSPSESKRFSDRPIQDCTSNKKLRNRPHQHARGAPYAQRCLLITALPSGCASKAACRRIRRFSTLALRGLVNGPCVAGVSGHEELPRVHSTPLPWTSNSPPGHSWPPVALGPRGILIGPAMKDLPDAAHARHAPPGAVRGGAEFAPILVSNKGQTGPVGFRHFHRCGPACFVRYLKRGSGR